MSALKAHAIEMIENVPEDRMPTLITFISTLTPRQEDDAPDESRTEMKASPKRPSQNPHTWRGSDLIDEFVRGVEELRKLDLETRIKMFAAQPPLEEELERFPDTSELDRERDKRILALFDDM